MSLKSVIIVGNEERNISLNLTKSENNLYDFVIEVFNNEIKENEASFTIKTSKEELMQFVSEL